MAHEFREPSACTLSRVHIRQRKILSGTLAAALIIGLTACTGSGAYTNTPSIQLEAKDYDLWDSTVGEFLLDDLWSDRDAYDASHLLMAPLDAAMRSTNAGWKEDFSDHFARFVEASSEVPSTVTSKKLPRLQYYYLASRFLSQATTENAGVPVPQELPGILLGELEETWLEYEAWQWEAPPFRGMRDRIEWKLTHDEVEKSYFRAIVDEELFTLAIAAEYRAYERKAVPREAWSPVVSDMLEVAETVIQQESTSTNDGWLFQTGVWDDHPDYRYAGILEPSPNMQPKAHDEVATDSSHASRWPLWLRSFRDAYSTDSEQYRQYDNDLELLANQFADKILVVPSRDVPYIRMNNYTDGWNGLFRWGYATTGEDSGYRAFELSGSLLVVWWGMLSDARVEAAYCELAESFPLSDEAIALYVVASSA